MRRQLDEFLAHGWFEPAHSGSGVSFAQNPYGIKRICVDIALEVVYPMTRIDGCLDHVRAAFVFLRFFTRSSFQETPRTYCVPDALWYVSGHCDAIRPL